MKPTLVFVVLLSLLSCKQQDKISLEGTDENIYQERYRPQYHFSPPTGWMNDPNGLVYNDGLYHLFYQYYPHATVWGPMHWGHAVSKDLVKWSNKPIALYPDENGFIFSGSAVVDNENTSGFGRDGVSPMVAIFTYHDLGEEKKGKNDFQTQGIAYSLDNGGSWTKYKGNPIIGNDGIRDFRDPKVFWHKDSQHWIMVLVAGDHARLYRSKNLKDWSFISEFGKDKGAHGGVWECPDLFPLPIDGTNEIKWVMIISIGSGAPNGGSGTQYFIGEFDGTTFTTTQETHKWLDWGTDNYAGVTYNDTPDNARTFIGWMSNWQYALKTPTNNFRSAMTLPRNLSLKMVDGEEVLCSYPVNALDAITNEVQNENFTIEPNKSEKISVGGLIHSKIRLKVPKEDFTISFVNASDNELKYIYDSASNLLMLDRTNAGKDGFNYSFGNKLHYMPLLNSSTDNMLLEVFLDESSSELFLNHGEQAMTSLVFPESAFDRVIITNLSEKPMNIESFSVSRLESIWQ